MIKMLLRPKGLAASKPFFRTFAIRIAAEESNWSLDQAEVFVWQAQGQLGEMP